MGGKKKGGGNGPDVVAIILDRSCAQQLAIALALALGGVSPISPKKGKGKKDSKGSEEATDMSTGGDEGGSSSKSGASKTGGKK